jgi:predicted PurR-regulated permease PerM
MPDPNAPLTAARSPDAPVVETGAVQPDRDAAPHAFSSGTPIGMSLAPTEMTRTVLGLIALLGMIAGSLWVLQPFIPGLIWATTIVIATWPLMIRIQRLLWNRRGLAVTVMIVAQLLLFFVPLSLAILTVVENLDMAIAWIRQASSWRPGDPPDWLARLPGIGARAVDLWQEFVAAGPGPLVAKALPHLGTFATRLLKEAGVLGAIGLQFLMTVAISGILYATGETAAEAVMRFARRLAGRRGEHTALLAAASIRGVALGVVVTAVAQSVLGGIGLAVVGVPAATLLTAVMFLLAIAQIGVIPVLLPAVIWLFWSGATGWGIVLLVWTVFVGTFDNFLRPWLIQKGANLPLLLIFAGVIGGLIAFGLVGIFIGPVVLAVTYTLLGAWMGERPARPPTLPPH